MTEQMTCGAEIKNKFLNVAKRGVRRWYKAYLQADIRRSAERKMKISERAYENLF